MREWTLIRDREEKTGNGILWAMNVSLDTVGELTRRKGTEKLTALGAKAINPYFSAGVNGVVLFTSTGTLETVAL
jgi:ribulose 1,5-bisphosphate carboxylase large subunit-like protein